MVTSKSTKIGIMKNIILLAWLSTAYLIVSCSNATDKAVTNDSVSKNSEEKKSETPSKDSTIYFRATGTEPFWGLEISDQQIVLNLIEDSIVTANPEPTKTKDANTETYRVKTQNLTLSIQVLRKDCTNGMSGRVSPYTVTIEYKRETDAKEEELIGCGNYLT